MHELKGIYSALITPYCQDGSVNYREIRRMVRSQADRGLTGFYVCGSTGEAFLLTLEERKKILEAVAGEVGGQAKIIAHVGNIGSALTEDLARHAKACGVDAVSAITPFYYQFSSQEIVSYYEDLANAVELPTVVYHFPGQTGVSLSPGQLDELAKNPYIAGVKFTSLDLFTLERIKQNHPELCVFNGHDEVLAYGLEAGADGGIGSTYNIMPQLYRELYDSFENGDRAQAQRLQHKANDVIAVLCKYGAVQGVKAVLELQGFQCGACRKPFRPLSKEAVKELENCCKAYL